MRRPVRFLLDALAGPGIVCLEAESYDAASPEDTIGVDFLIHKPGIS